MTANFGRWEADPFFSAAEDVQDSADRLESAYRSWVSARNATDSDPSYGENLDNSVDILRRELQTALGTAKWQAVVLFSMGGYGSYLGWQIRLSDDVEVKAKAKDLHPKLLGGMFFFFALGATGGIISLLTSAKPILER